MGSQLAERLKEITNYQKQIAELTVVQNATDKDQVIETPPSCSLILSLRAHHFSTTPPHHTTIAAASGHLFQTHYAVLSRIGVCVKRA